MTQRSHLFLLLFFFNQIISLLSEQETGFIYNNFKQAQANLHLDGSAKILLPNGLLQLTNATKQQMGHAFFKKPLKFNSSQKLSFWTHFVCALVPEPGSDGGHGIAFVLSPSLDLSQADPTQYLGLFNISTNGSPSSKLLAIELDTAESSEFDDIDKNHVGIDINKLPSVESASASYFSDTKGKKNQSLTLLSGDPIQVWVDYEENILNVTLAPLRIRKPKHPLLSRFINLTEIFPDQSLFIGFSASTGSLVSYQYILGWSFSKSRVILQSLDFSKLPQVPHPRDKHKETSALLTALLMLLILILLVILGGVYLYRRNKYAEVREDWEKEYGPHRFSYESLYKATKGFDKDRHLGKGGFGEVYKGNLPQIGDIAVKRVSHDAKQGMKQFVAEVVTMGSLKHKNLVPLLGYCRRKHELLLVSEFMVNGSLDRYLFHREKPVLSWLQRVKILKDIASAISYLHTGANQVVLHRDIKASNVMLDGEYNGRLGDFGMAKFQDNGDSSLPATAAVGTMGYIASEITTMGASTRTDVYAFGSFMLEVTCGRRPLDPKMADEKRHLSKWVCECWRKDSLLDAIDSRLGENFSKEESEMILKLGLLCTNVVAESRPSMEQVVQYINQNLPLPHFSPDSPGIGVPTPAFMETASMAIASISRSTLAPARSLPSPNNSMFVTHTITYGDGR